MLPKEWGARIQDEPKYSIQPSQFQYLENIDPLTARHFEVFSGGTLNIGLLEEGGGYSVFHPEPYFAVKNQVIIPKNFHTLSLLSTAYQFDFILSELEAMTSIHPDSVLKVKGKFTLFHDVKIVKLANQETIIHNNAAYLNGNHSIATLKTNQIERIPISVNLSILAHEFGHLLVDFITKDSDTLSYFDEYEMKGINEGFSDLLAYTITGSSNILRGTFDDTYRINGLSPLEQRDFTDPGFKYSQRSRCILEFYCIGIIFNHAFYRTQLDLQLNPLDKMDRYSSFQVLWQALTSTMDQLETPSYPPADCIPYSNHYEMTHLTHFLHLLVSNIPDQRFRCTFAKNLRIDFEHF